MVSLSFSAALRVLPLASLALACGPTDIELEASLGGDQAPFTSALATLLDFRFHGQFVTSSTGNLRQLTQDQMLYTIGQLNGQKAVGRLDTLELTNFSSTPIAGGLSRVEYDARLPVAWGKKTTLPVSFELILPARVDFDGLQAFTSAYKTSCVAPEAHEVDSGSMWYYYRPGAPGCALAVNSTAGESGAVRFTATVSTATINTSGKYPEYDQVWSDGELRVVAIFGKNKSGSTTDADAGVSAFNTFVYSAKNGFGVPLQASPADVPMPPGATYPDVTLSGAAADGRKLSVTALLVDAITSTDLAFNQRYNALSTNADVIFYNGHAGLGQNVRALAKKGTFAPGKYQIFFINGCDTFAYVDGSLAQTRALLNPGDPTGTKYMDIVTNAMPSFFDSNANTTMTFLAGLFAKNAPKTYQQIFSGIDPSQIVVVTGEEDNVFAPPGPGSTWAGFTQTASVENGASMNFETPELAVGKYVFTTADEPGQVSGDVDLYVRVGAAPTLSIWDKRPYKNGSAESVTLTLKTPSKVYLMVHGYESSPASPSHFVLKGKPAKAL